MNKGVEILLERMKSNPEEFMYTPSQGMGKWMRLLDEYNHVLTDEEKTAINNATKEVAREQLTQRVMKELLDPKSESNPYLDSFTKGMQLGGATLGSPLAYNNATATLSAKGNLTTNSLTLGKTEIQEQQLQQLLAMKVQMEVEKAKVEQKQQTLVGKLYNYLGSNK